ncbi:hypothetical protein BJ508DRAFT_361310 [Ascobolus immersus RN42]|uniref:Uncharacterized protein n=1 Tax=Ascobolus immersus RN42 TaxID=1160509 RepID=A0A3N4ICJ1_ASCIM|nr:hypothetical protein BJ508DRAFT_361310 [Ascobolus immersus RN42]
MEQINCIGASPMFGQLEQITRYGIGGIYKKEERFRERLQDIREGGDPAALLLCGGEAELILNRTVIPNSSIAARIAGSDILLNTALTDGSASMVKLSVFRTFIKDKNIRMFDNLVEYRYGEASLLSMNRVGPFRVRIGDESELEGSLGVQDLVALCVIPIVLGASQLEVMLPVLVINDNVAGNFDLKICRDDLRRTSIPITWSGENNLLPAFPATPTAVKIKSNILHIRLDVIAGDYRNGYGRVTLRFNQDSCFNVEVTFAQIERFARVIMPALGLGEKRLFAVMMPLMEGQLELMGYFFALLIASNLYYTHGYPFGHVSVSGNFQNFYTLGGAKSLDDVTVTSLTTRWNRELCMLIHTYAERFVGEDNFSWEESAEIPWERADWLDEMTLVEEVIDGGVEIVGWGLGSRFELGRHFFDTERRRPRNLDAKTCDDCQEGLEVMDEDYQNEEEVVSCGVCGVNRCHECVGIRSECSRTA